MITCDSIKIIKFQLIKIPSHVKYKSINERKERSIAHGVLCTCIIV
jgi:hypothetical protein